MTRWPLPAGLADTYLVHWPALDVVNTGVITLPALLDAAADYSPDAEVILP